MKSYKDHTKDAVGVCMACGRAVAAEDAVTVDGKLYCKECAEKKAKEKLEPKRLYRSSKNKMLGGVCGGIAEYLNVDPTIVRIIFVALMLIPPLTLWTRFWIPLVAYVILWIIVPER